MLNGMPAGNGGFRPIVDVVQHHYLSGTGLLGPDRPRADAGERGQRARESAEDELLGDQPSNANDQADSGLSIIIICPGLDSRPGLPLSTCWRAWSAREGKC